jgi:hypothetical protein
MDLSKFGEGFFLKETVRAEIWRGDKGFYSEQPDEVPEVTDLVVTTGRNFLALRIGPAVNSPMNWMVIGSGTTAPALTDGSTPGVYGEIKRKSLATNTAGITASNVYTAVCTFGGAAESIQSIAITEAGIANHVNSGQGTLFQRVTFSGVTLADSDLLKITLETNVGSS